MSQIKLTIAVAENMKNDLISEAKMNNMTLSELCRAKLSQEYKTERMTNNQIFKLTDMCYRLIMQMLILNNGNNDRIRQILDYRLNEEVFDYIAKRDDSSVTELFECYIEKIEKAKD